MSVVLAVDDHPPARLLMQAIVSDLTPYRCVAVGSCAEARKIVPGITPMLYLIDLDLPDGDGLTLAAELVALHAAPVIITSAFAETADERTAAANLFAYLKKPIVPDDVARLIERAAARHE